MHDEGGYLVLSDSTRDGYPAEEKKGDGFAVQEFQELKMFEEFVVREGSTPVTIGVLTNEADLTADDFRTYWNEGTTEVNQAFLLFVI